MNGLTAAGLTIDIQEEDDALHLLWTGKSIDRQPSQTLDPFFAKALAEATKKGARVEMHFERLTHFNSSTISCLIRLIPQARALGVKLVLAYDAASSWQQVSFDALRVFAKNSPHFELRKVSQ